MLHRDTLAFKMIRPERALFCECLIVAVTGSGLGLFFSAGWILARMDPLGHPFWIWKLPSFAKFSQHSRWTAICPRRPRPSLEWMQIPIGINITSGLAKETPNVAATHVSRQKERYLEVQVSSDFIADHMKPGQVGA